MLNRINQSLTEKKEDISEEPKYDEEAFGNLWNKTVFNDSEFWFLKNGWYILCYEIKMNKRILTNCNIFYRIRS